jgi:hypothetical protein
MAYTRRDPRTTQTEDLSATLWSARRSCVVGRVLNLSEGGMLVASRGLEVGETAGLELAAPDFRFGGVAKVAHRTDRAVGLHFMSWQGPADRPICTLIAARLLGELGSPDAGRRDPRVLRRVVVFIGTDTVERAPPTREPQTVHHTTGGTAREPKISLKTVLQTVAELGGASPGLIAWELGADERSVTPAWSAAIREGLLERARYDPIDQDWQYELTIAGREHLRALEPNIP